MSESSDSDIIFRKRPASRKIHRPSDEFTSSEIVDHSEIVEGDFEPLFFEIFGNGDEYSYIYKKKNGNEEQENTRDRCEISVSECYAYVQGFLRGFNSLFKELDSKIVEELIEGYSPEYLSFHLGKMTVKELYFVKDLIDEFKEETSKVQIKHVVASESRIQGLITCSEFVVNMESFESVFHPQGNIDVPFDVGISTKDGFDNGWDYDEIQGLEIEKPAPTLDDTDKDIVSKHFKKTISQIASNPIFLKRVVYSTIISVLEPSFCENSVHSLGFLQKLYCSGQNDMNDQLRKTIVQKAYEAVAVDKSIIERRLVDQGMIEGPNGLQELVDLIISLRGRPGSYAGVYLDKTLFSVVRIDGSGNFVASSIFKEHELSELHAFLSDVDNVCLTSTSPSVKFALQNAGINFFYVPRKLSFFDDYKELSIPYNIALVVQNPLLYFARLLYNLSNGYPVCNYRFVDPGLLERGISIACAVCKLDWISTLSHKFGFILFKLLKIDISDPYFNFERLDALESLKHVFDNVKCSNACTYFNLLSSENPLDKTLIHPVNYSMAIILFKSAYHSLLSAQHDSIMNRMHLDLEKDESKIIELFVNQPELLASYSTIGMDGDKDMQTLADLKQIMLREDEVYFAGASDAQVFDDVVPHLEQNQTYSGTVTKVGNSFYLCQVSNATVYIRKSSELALNQIVKVEITGSNPPALSYSGNVVEEEGFKVDKFRSHSLFRNMPYDALEKHMRESNKSLAIRPSSTPSCCCVVCKIEDDLFFTYKLKETIKSEDGFKISYEFKNRYYSSIDAFIDDYIKKTYNMIGSIVSFKYYFADPAQAQRHIEEPGEFVKYSIVLSRKVPGCLEFLLSGKHVFSKIDGDRLILKEHSFETLDDLIRFIKTHIKSL
ncbi:uncharacterized protein VICG_01439 [Vittaforma corneae ATCC 50505]|uniref:Spt6 SH2 domain-containing protein n=1 Tax=Vittaforma corneae (strain ATCC 50505) TaxID=993615 RepID=L2GM54_VITCO|nr:uncharacterized protein VICG_01439 [Vittaforma corneae ATCC 50505]ELA41575.1 hypothetical protein VICG_01439 [Vittaforma corneae ATCC 50505]